MNRFDRGAIMGLSLFVFGIYGLGTGGCRFQREVDVPNENENEIHTESIENGKKTEQTAESAQTGEKLYVTGEAVDVEACVLAFLGGSMEEAEPYFAQSWYDYWVGYDSREKVEERDSWLYEKDGFELQLSKDSITGAGIISYQDRNGAAATAYSRIITLGNLLSEGLDCNMRIRFPEEDLDSCTAEEAISICQEYADACGYQDSNVAVYAITLEDIERIRSTYSGIADSLGAPDPNYQWMTSEEEYRIRVQLEEAQQNGNEELAEKLNQQLEEALNNGSQMNAVAWEKKDEAMLLVYRPRINGIILDGEGQMLTIVYVPELAQVVLASGQVPYRIQAMDTEQSLISEEQAISTAMLELGIEERDQISISSISLVYSIRATEIYSDSPTINPCWRIDYVRTDKKKEEYGTIRIDAITGFYSQYSDL